RVLVLDGTSVSSDELAAWRREHPQSYVYTSQRRTIETTRRLLSGFLMVQGASLEKSAEVEKWFGNAFFRRAVSLAVTGTTANDDLARLANLPDLERVGLSYTPVDDGAL